MELGFGDLAVQSPWPGCTTDYHHLPITFGHPAARTLLHPCLGYGGVLKGSSQPLEMGTLLQGSISLANLEFILVTTEIWF